VAFSSSLDDDSQGAQFLAPRIPNRALPKRGPCYTFPDVHVANGSIGRGAVLLPPGQSTKHPSLLSCRYFLTPLNTCDSNNCSKLSLSLSLSLLDSRCRRQTQLKTFSSGPVNEALRMRRTSSRTRKSKRKLQLRMKNNYRCAFTVMLHKRCDACIKQGHSQRAERRVREARPRNKPRNLSLVAYLPRCRIRHPAVSCSKAVILRTFLLGKRHLPNQ
jgi:hypothetical protein